MSKNDCKYFFSCPGNIVVIRCLVLFTHIFWNCHIWVVVLFQKHFRQKNLEFLCLNLRVGVIYFYCVGYMPQRRSSSLVPLFYLLIQLVQTDSIFAEKQGVQTGRSVNNSLIVVRRLLRITLASVVYGQREDGATGVT